jgi:hypothetical protein
MVIRNSIPTDQVFGIDFQKLFSDNSGMAKPKSNRGGARPGAGRPPLPPGERRDQIFAVKLTTAEKELLDSASAREWARGVLVRTAERKVKQK